MTTVRRNALQVNRWGLRDSRASSSLSLSVMAHVSGNQQPRASSSLANSQQKESEVGMTRMGTSGRTRMIAGMGDCSRAGFATAVATSGANGLCEDEHLEALLSTLRTSASNSALEDDQRCAASAQDLCLFEASPASKATSYFDKILILARHGEAEHNVFEREWVKGGNDPDQAYLSDDYPRDPMLSPKGIGEILNLSRRTAEFYNDETHLVPELFVMSPLRCATQTGLLAFPEYAPGSVREKTWLCHNSLMECANGTLRDSVSNVDELQESFPGVDYSLCRNPTVANLVSNTGLGRSEESKADLLQRTNSFLEWVKGRDERIIFVSSHAAWLQCFCDLTLKLGSQKHNWGNFKSGEMRAIGITFD